MDGQFRTFAYRRVPEDEVVANPAGVSLTDAVHGTAALAAVAEPEEEWEQREARTESQGGYKDENCSRSEEGATAAASAGLTIADAQAASVEAIMPTAEWGDHAAAASIGPSESPIAPADPAAAMAVGLHVPWLDSQLPPALFRIEEPPIDSRLRQEAQVDMQARALESAEMEADGWQGGDGTSSEELVPIESEARPPSMRRSCAS